MRKAEIVERVNALVQDSFGHYNRGDYHIISGGLSGGTLEKRKDCLEVVASKTWFGDPSMGAGVKGVLNANGSVIAVLKKYEAKAKKYAELYRQEFGRRVKVITKNSFYELFPTEGLGSQTPFPLNVNSL